MPPQDITHLHLLINHVPDHRHRRWPRPVRAVVRAAERTPEAREPRGVLPDRARDAPGYMTGLAAQATILGRPDVSAEAIVAHHDGALLAFILMRSPGSSPGSGCGSTAGWADGRLDLAGHPGAGGPHPGHGRAAPPRIGGQIRHPEIMLDEAAVARRRMVPCRRR